MGVFFEVEQWLAIALPKDAESSFEHDWIMTKS